MSLPNFGGSFESENPSPVIIQPEGRFVQDPNSSGLVVPEAYARNKAAKLQAEQQATSADVQSEVLSDDASSSQDQELQLTEELDAKGDGDEDKTTAERVEENEASLVEIDDSPAMSAQSEEDFITASADEASQRGEDPEQAKDRARKWLDRASVIAGMTFDQFQEANQGSSMDLFIKAFLVFDVDGRFGGTSSVDLRGALQEGSDDAYLDKALSSGDPAELLSFFKVVLGKENLDHLDDIKSLISELNIQIELNWDEVKKKFAAFLDNRDGYKDNRNFDKIRHVFARLEGMTQEKILEYFKIDLTETAKADPATQTTPVETVTPVGASSTTEIEPPVEVPLAA